jgi:hypothetical protein
VTINDTTPNAVIYYTTNGSTPTTSSAMYSGPITVSSTETLEAIATATGYTTSGIMIGVYTINLPAAATPTFSPTAGTYSSTQTVTISDTTPNAVIYYTTNGSTPTTSSAVYSGPITVSSTETLEAIATATGYTTSGVATAVYAINLPAAFFTITGTSMTLTKGATTGNTSTITVTPSNGFTGTVTLTCAITPTAANDPASCSIPASVTISGTTAQTATLTVYTTGATAYNQPMKLLWPSAGGAVLALVFFFGIPARRRSWRTMLGMMVLLVIVAGGMLACGGPKINSGGGGGGNSGTTPGSYIITVTGTSGSIIATGTVALTVQ